MVPMDYQDAGDEEEPEDDFEDWIDKVNSFIHMINPHTWLLSTLPQ